MSTARPVARRGAPPDAPMTTAALIDQAAAPASPPELTAAQLSAAEAETLDARRLGYCRLVHAVFEVMDLAYGPNHIHAPSPASWGGAAPRSRSSTRARHLTSPRLHETRAERSRIPGKERT
jgi:hypothetical protein